MSLQGQNVLITGGTGSFGQAAARYLLEQEDCAKVIIFSRDEWKQWEMRRADPIFDHPNIRYFIGDVRDRKRLHLAFQDVDIVIHAAALKQVTAAEYNPTEFIQTNILGAMNIVENAMDCGVKKVIALSTDKSVNPINLYGATKLCSDKLFIASNSYVGSRGYPLFSVVRYGNVLGSRGSLIPRWQENIDHGATKLTITDPEMTRFWITLNQSVAFVLKSLEIMRGREIFVPKIPSIKIVDLAKAFAPEMPHEIVGIREGEKRHELLISADEAHYTLDCGDYYIVSPPVYKTTFADRIEKIHSGMKVPTDFIYRSDTNPLKLDVEGAKKLLANN